MSIAEARAQYFASLGQGQGQAPQAQDSIAQKILSMPIQSDESAFGNGLKGLLARTTYGFSDDETKKSYIKKMTGKEVTTLKNGEFGTVEIDPETGRKIIRPVDPKGFQFSDIAGDIAESLGKTITTSGGILGGLVGTLTGPVGTVVGSGIGSAVGEGIRQNIGERLGVRTKGFEAKDANEILFEGTIGSLAEGFGLLAPKIAKTVGQNGVKKLNQFFAKEVDSATPLAQKMMTQSTENLYKNSAEQFANENVDDVAKLVGEVPMNVKRNSARLADQTGIDDNIWSHLSKRTDEGKMIEISNLAKEEADDLIANNVLKIRDEANKLKKFGNKLYSEALEKVDQNAIIESPELIAKQALAEGAQEAPETVARVISDVLDESPQLQRILQKSKLIDQSGVPKQSLTIKELLEARDAINDTGLMKQHWLAKSQGKPELSSPESINLSRIDGIIRNRINKVPELSEVNKIYGEIVDPVKKTQALMTDARGERNLFALKDPKGKMLRVDRPLKEFEAVILKYGKNAGAEPVYDKVMDAVTQSQLGTWQNAYKSTGPLKEMTKGIPVVQGVVNLMSSPAALAKAIQMKSKISNFVKSPTDQLVNVIDKTLGSKKAKQVSNVIAKNAKRVARLSRQATPRSLNSVVFGDTNGSK